MSATVSRGGEAGHQEVARVPTQHTGPRRRPRRGATGVVVLVVLAAGAAGAWRAGVFRPPGPSEVSAASSAPAMRVVVRGDLSATTPVNATLGYAGSYTVRGQGGGTLTWLPAVGRVIRQGQALYKTGNGSPVVLLYGSVPAWRSLNEGVTGADVRQLNRDLVKLGYADRAGVVAAGWDCYSWETAQAVQRLEEHLGVPSPPGSLTLGQVVFEPEPLRVSQVAGSLGGAASGPVLKATTDRRQVAIPLDASDQSEVKVGDAVTVTLPDGTITPGVVSSVGKVATTATSASGPGQDMTTTIPVDVKLTRPKAAGNLDQAPVMVDITTDSVKDALAVPVGALLAQSPGGYDVEVAGPGNTRRYVPVRPGIFDDASGLVQVTGALVPGQRVVVPAS